MRSAPDSSRPSRYFEGRSPLGARICECSGPDAKPNIEIVGVVTDFSYRGLREESEQAYFALSAREGVGGNFYIRVRGTPEAAFQSIRTVSHNADPALPVIYFRTLALGRLVQSQLFGVIPTDASAIAVATLIPAYRASTVNPTDALRFE